MNDQTLADSQKTTANKTKVKTGRGYILLVAILQSFGAISFGFMVYGLPPTTNEEIRQGLTMAAVTVGLIAALYFGLWVWAKWHPFPAAVTALVVYAALFIWDASVDPTQIAKGIFLKLLIVFALISAISSSYKLRKLKESEIPV